MIEVSIFQLFVIFMIILYIIKYPRVGKNSPPLVPYKIPLLGHTFDYLFNTKKFMEESRKQYGECFSIYVFGQVWTIVTGTPLNEVFKYSEHFDFLSAIQEYLPMHKFLPYNGGFTEEGNELNAKTSREHVSGKLDLNIGTVQQYLSKGMDKWIGDCNEPKAIYNIWYTANDIAALPVANILVGEEAASHEDLVNSFAKVAFDVGHLMLIPPIFSFIHPKLHEFIITLPMRIGWNPVSRHRKIVMNRLRPVVEKRLRERNKLGDNYKPYNDLLEYYMNLPDFNYTEPNNFHYHVDNLFIMVFASIHTTSRSVAVALLDIAGRPEVSNELYEEAVTIDKECNGILTVADVKRMVKLDSFVKETLRLNENLLALPHYVRSESYTFSNGYTIPRGHKVMMYLDDHLRSKEHYGDDADEFKPFRFVNKNSPATKVERSYVIFGGGRHACPGRFFAINETKVILHKLILQYKISTESGKVEDKIMIGPFAVPPSTGIVFENRVKNN